MLLIVQYYPNNFWKQGNCFIYSYITLFPKSFLYLSWTYLCQVINMKEKKKGSWMMSLCWVQALDLCWPTMKSQFYPSKLQLNFCQSSMWAAEQREAPGAVWILAVPEGVLRELLCCGRRGGHKWLRREWQACPSQEAEQGKLGGTQTVQPCQVLTLDWRLQTKNV